jgi:hypothetical protein
VAVHRVQEPGPPGRAGRRVAGAPFQEGSESIIISMFSPKGGDNSDSNNSGQSPQTGAPSSDDDEIPF